MDRRRLISLGAGVLGAAVGLRSAAIAADRAAPFAWGVDYGPATDSLVARTYDLLVLEPHHPRPIAPLRKVGGTLLGYVSFGEVERSRPYHARLAAAGALGDPNPNWPDARHVDLRHPAWRDAVLNEIVPGILALGYDGIFIDTLDNAEAMEIADARLSAGMVAAAATLVADVRTRFPRIRIMLNRGYAALPLAARSIDYLLGEAMASRWSFADKRYELLPAADWAWQADRLRAARVANPALTLATLDYWDPTDRRGVADLYARERAAGFMPYVATLALDRLLPERVA